MMRALNVESSNTPSMFVIFVSLGVVLLVLLAFLAAILNCNSEDFVSLRSYLTFQVDGEGSDEQYRNRLARILESKKKEKEETASQRRERLLKNFHKDQVIMEVTTNDLIDSCHTISIAGSGSTDSNEIDGNELGKKESIDNYDNITVETFVDNPEETSKLKLPVMPSTTEHRQVPNNCAICLSSYEIGDKVVWSSNEKCNHAFHVDCIVEWLIKMQEGTPCPCCRQEFTNLPPFVPQNTGDISDRTSFNPDVISFRRRT